MAGTAFMMAYTSLACRGGEIEKNNDKDNGSNRRECDGRARDGECRELTGSHMAGTAFPMAYTSLACRNKGKDKDNDDTQQEGVCFKAGYVTDTECGQLSGS